MRVLRSQRPDAEEARAHDRAFLPGAIRRFLAACQTPHMIRPEPNLFVPDHRPRFMRVVGEMRQAVLGWTRSAPPGVRTATWDAEVLPRQALRENGKLLGFDLLRVRVPWELVDGADDYPTPCDADGSHGPHASFVTYAFMLQTELHAHRSPHIDLHVLTQGARQFADRLPIFRDPIEPGARGEPLATYVHTETNLREYIAALVASPAFCEAANTPYHGKRLRRIVVPVLLTGHFELFGWDRVWGPDGAPVHDRLFVMTSMIPEAFPIDLHVSSNLLGELQRQLRLPHAELTPYPGAGTILRARTKSPGFLDMDCVYYSMLYTFFLGMLEDINDPATAPLLARPEVWHGLRAAYMVYEERLLRLLEAHAACGEPVLLGASWDATFLNVRDARLVVVSAESRPGDAFAIAPYDARTTRGGAHARDAAAFAAAAHYRYSWSDGWLPSAAAARGA